MGKGDTHLEGEEKGTDLFLERAAPAATFQTKANFSRHFLNEPGPTGFIALIESDDARDSVE